MYVVILKYSVKTPPSAARGSITPVHLAVDELRGVCGSMWGRPISVAAYLSTTSARCAARCAALLARALFLCIWVWVGVSECVGGAREKASERVTEREKAE